MTTRIPAATLAAATLLLGLGLLTACDDAAPPPAPPATTSIGQDAGASGSGGQDHRRPDEPTRTGGQPTRSQPRPTTGPPRPTTQPEYPPSNCPAGLVC